MKKTFLFLALIISLTVINAQPKAGAGSVNSRTKKSLTIVTAKSVMGDGLFNEIFSYNDGALAGQGGWIEVGTFTAGSGSRSVATGALTYSDAGGTYVNSGLGKAMVISILSGSTVSDFKAYEPFSATAVNSGVIYIFIFFT